MAQPCAVTPFGQLPSVAEQSFTWALACGPGAARQCGEALSRRPPPLVKYQLPGWTHRLDTKSRDSAAPRPCSGAATLSLNPLDPLRAWAPDVIVLVAACLACFAGEQAGLPGLIPDCYAVVTVSVCGNARAFWYSQTPSKKQTADHEIVYWQLQRLYPFERLSGKRSTELPVCRMPHLLVRWVRALGEPRELRPLAFK